jgi:GTP-binding protein
MKKFAFNHVQFLTSSTTLEGCPKIFGSMGKPLPEIAVAGRSNVGKSSLLNNLFNIKNLVKTSQSPGKTRLLNFFQVDGDCIFCDLPGYGFAQVEEKVKGSWKQMIENYIEERESLKLVLLLLDIRRTPSDQDLQFFEWIQYLKIPLILVFTKVDKLTKGGVASSIKKNLKILNGPNLPKVQYSVLKNEGRKELIYEIKAALNDSDVED